MGFLTRIARGLAVHGYFTVNGSEPRPPTGFRHGDGLDRTRPFSPPPLLPLPLHQPGFGARHVPARARSDPISPPLPLPACVKAGPASPRPRGSWPAPGSGLGSPRRGWASDDTVPLRRFDNDPERQAEIVEEGLLGPTCGAGLGVDESQPSLPLDRKPYEPRPAVRRASSSAPSPWTSLGCRWR